MGVEEQTNREDCQSFDTSQASFYLPFKEMIKIHILNKTFDTESLAASPSPKASQKWKNSGKNRLMLITYLLSAKLLTYAILHQHSLITSILMRKLSLRG